MVDLGLHSLWDMGKMVGQLTHGPKVSVEGDTVKIGMKHLQELRGKVRKLRIPDDIKARLEQIN